MESGAPGPSGKGGPHAFVDDLDAPVLGADDRHHLSRVVRLRVGDALTVSDGRGRWRACRFGDELEVSGPVESVAPASPPISIAFALVKGQKPEWVVQKLTELGVDRIRPFVAARSVVRWDEAKAEAATLRLRRVAREASMQSRRCWLPLVELPVAFASLAAEPEVSLAEREGPPLVLDGTTVAIGPEGGWDPDELRSVRRRVGLGDHVLRAETAAMAAGVLLAAARAGKLPEH